jgi:hypothetical protein
MDHAQVILIPTLQRHTSTLAVSIFALGRPLLPPTSLSNTHGAFRGLFWGAVGSSPSLGHPLQARDSSGTPA